MLQIQYFLSAPQAFTWQEATQPAASQIPLVQPRRRRLRLYLVGSDGDTRGAMVKDRPPRAIASLHHLGYAEQFEWSHVVDIPEGGLLVRPDPGDVLRYLQRYPSVKPL
ncbi:hypothetical protein [Pseudanabaena sp. FACHB-2040]|uniref:hypothetical protein n=1 Tax=Pseudanabaena sp. FACHB-2040 TaxID=2692859 RepID=UPI001687D570|nr:hypothetical protein [Pseudanabaena sp. FACHB-2040]MBD2257704.1 hypothetical protein [Pseudanabaena sp. FACHB-2040]